MNPQIPPEAIKSYNLPIALFFLELQEQCWLASYSFNKLIESRKGWLKDASPEELHNAATPLEILTYCNSFLSSAAIISKILFPNSKKRDIQNRAENLRLLIEINKLQALTNLTVRNSFEHIDERLDVYFSKFKRGAIVPFSMTEEAPSPETFVLKRFDPRNLIISFANQKIHLAPCFEEIQMLDAKIADAYGKLTGSKIKLWG